MSDAEHVAGSQRIDECAAKVESVMRAKSVFLVFGVVSLSVIASFVSGPTDPSAEAVRRWLPSDTLFATVEIDSLKVLSYVDDAGIEHSVDSTLVPPVPIQGLRNVLFLVRARVSPEAVAGGAQ